MNLRSVFVYLLLASVCHEKAFGQTEADIWVMGYYANNDPGYGIMFFEFIDGELVISHDSKTYPWSLDGVNASVCKPSGELALVTNGTKLYSYAYPAWSDTICYGPYWELWQGDEDGFPAYDCGLILPIPGSQGEYSVIYTKYGTDTLVYSVGLMESRVRLNESAVPTILYADSTYTEGPYSRRWGISSTRHANGRDWWVLQMDAHSKYYFRLLLDPDGLHYVGMDSTPIYYPFSESAKGGFSPSGAYFTRAEFDATGNTHNISLFAFDRCEGRLTFIDSFPYGQSIFVGNAFSPSERYLYGTEYNLLWQWDLYAADIKGSRILVDSNNFYTWPGWQPQSFGALVNGPDDKIYLIGGGGGSHTVSTIHRPDEPAENCRFYQDDIILPIWTSHSPPNLPNFRLGPLDGSPCDTLGINNLPVARWRWEIQDSSDLKKIRFTDLSYFRPEEWHWDFDDGITSDTSHPIHTFPGPGLYHVCLTVSNEYASDSICKWIEISDSITLVSDIKKEFSFRIQPNPFEDYIDILHEGNNYQWYDLKLTDLTGRPAVSTGMIIPGRLKLPSLPSGVYVIQLMQDQKPVWVSKIVKGE